MVLIGDEVGGNIEMTGDGHIGQEKFICEKVCIAQRKTIKKSKHFTVIGNTNLLGDLIFCIAIIEGKDYFLILGLVLIYPNIKLDIRVMEKNTFT